MDKEKLKQEWLKEESVASIHGWDFSHITTRYQESKNLPWDYKEIILKYLHKEHTILDIDTGGGEFLLTLNHPYENTYATEGYPPNIELCKKELSPLGIHFSPAKNYSQLPFNDATFDMVINRHGDYDLQEIYRILKPNGLFITQQVGAENDRELVDLLLPNTPIPFPNQTLDIATSRLNLQKFTLLEAQEAYRPIEFYDVGALVWFAKIIEWEFPGFSVNSCLDALYQAQSILEKNGKIEGQVHRYLFVIKKHKGEAQCLI